MRSKRQQQITLLFFVFYIIVLTSNTLYINANPNPLHQERREYHMQRSSSSSVGNSGGFYNAQGLQHADLAERLRQQFNTALLNAGGGASGYYRTSSSYSTGTNGNGITCTTECKLVPTANAVSTVRSQAELDLIARDMTNQIVSDLQAGRIQSNQLNQQYFDQQVANKLSSLQQHHQQEFQRNLQAAANRFHQQHQQNIFNQQQGVAFVQPTAFSQSQQQQHQGQFFQQQSQSQQSFLPVIQPTGSTYHKTQMERHEESHSNRVYPTPVTVLHGTNILQQNNCTSENQQVVVPTIPTIPLPSYNLQNRYDHRYQTNRQTSHVAPTYIAPVITGGKTYQATSTVQRNEHRVQQPVPVVIPTQNTYTQQNVETVQRNEHRVHQPVPVVIPTQNTYTQQNVEQNSQVYRQHQQPVVPQIYGFNRINRTQHEEESHFRNQTHAPVQPIYTTGTNVVSQTHQTNSNVNNANVYQPAPIPGPVTHTVHNVYESEEEDVVPNYRPHVVIDQNTKFHELNVQNQHRDYHQPAVVIPTQQTHTTQTQVEEDHVHRHVQQAPVVVRPTYTTSTVTKEEQEQINRQTHSQQPTVYYPQGTVSQTVNEEHTVHRHHQQPQPQLPVFSTHTEVRNFTEGTDQNVHGTTIYQQQPGGHKVTTIKETHYVQILPQSDNQYSVQYTEEEYLERLNRIQQELNRLGYGTLSEQEYNATIASGGFIHNGYKYLYNTDHGRYEKTDRVEITEEEYTTLLQRLQDELHRYNLGEMTETEYNTTIDHGYFVRNGVRFIYNSETGRYYKEELTTDQYNRLHQQVENELVRLGLGSLTESEINQTIATGQVVINGQKYDLNFQTGQFVKSTRIDISEQEYRTILRRLQDQLRRLGFGQMTESEYNQTISTGYFVRGGNKYVYNANIGQYEKVELTEGEYNVILTRLQDTLNRLNYRQMSELESNETIATGSFIRGGYEWSYNTETGEANAVRVAGPFEEISEEEYRLIYKRLQETLTRLGYPRMSESEANKTITSGTFTRGGNQWVFQADVGEFTRVEISETEYNYRLNALIDVLSRLGIEKTADEYRQIINRGNFYHNGHRYEFDVTSGQFLKVQLTEAEYQERVRKLQEQLQKIGYGQMTESECRATINSGVFYFGGYEWVYNPESGWYEMGQRSDKENGIVDNNVFSNINLDSTNYGSTSDGNNEIGTGVGQPNEKPGRKPEEINKNRGDQPPQIVDNDYSSEEVEPGLTQPPISRPPPPPRTEPPPRPYVAPLAPIVVAQPTAETEYERHYHRKQTTYTQTSGLPIQYAVPVVPGSDVRSRPRKSGSTGFDDDDTQKQVPININSNRNNRNRHDYQHVESLQLNAYNEDNQKELLQKPESFADELRQLKEEEETDRQRVLTQQSDDLQRHYQTAKEIDDLNLQTEDRQTNTRFSGVLPNKYKSNSESTTEIIVEAEEIKEKQQPGFWTNLKNKAKNLIGV